MYKIIVGAVCLIGTTIMSFLGEIDVGCYFICTCISSGIVAFGVDEVAKEIRSLKEEQELFEESTEDHD